VKPVELIELSEAAIRGLIGRQGIALEPAIAAVLVEVIAGVDGLVDEGWVEYAELGRRWCCLGQSHASGED
jgi:hypothetical protein